MEVSLKNAVERAAKWQMVMSSPSPSLSIQSIESWMDVATRWIHKPYEYLILSPLARLYLYGPALGGWGFWNGMDLSIICAQKTQLSPEFWNDHPYECIQIVSRNFYSVVVLCETVLYFMFVWMFVKCVITVCCQCRRFKCYTAKKIRHQSSSSFTSSDDEDIGDE